MKFGIGSTMAVALWIVAGVAAQVPQGDAPASDAPETTTSAVTDKNIHTLRGTGKLAAASRWHTLDEEQMPVAVVIDMSNADMPQLFDALAAATENGKDDATDALLKDMARRILTGMRVKPGDDDKFTRFSGSGEVRDYACVVKTEQSKIAAVEDAAQPAVQFEFQAIVITSGRLGNRYGPNTWRNDWTFAVSGSITRLDGGRYAWRSLEVDYSVAGKFYTPGATDTAAPWTGQGEARWHGPDGAGAEHDAARLARVRELIEQLGDDSYWQREAAQTELKRLAREFRAVLEAHAVDHADAEVRMRLRQIIKHLQGQQLAMPQGWFAMW